MSPGLAAPLCVAFRQTSNQEIVRYCHFLLPRVFHMSKLKKALEKAKKARESGGTIFMEENTRPASTLKAALEKSKRPQVAGHQEAVQENATEKQVAVTHFPQGHQHRSDVLINYSKTKVQPVDLKKLRNKKLVSLFQGIEGAEQIKTLRTQILSRLEEIGGNSIVVTSANPGEGKTFTSINLGISIAQELDRTVLLVDADLKQPLNGHFDFARDFFCVDVACGLADYLTGKIDIPELLLNPGIQKLTILPGGGPVANSTELLGSPRMEFLVNEMKNRYKDDRIIIFDTSSVLYCADAIELSKFVDGILLVVEEEKTTGNQLKRVLELLENRKVLGSVLNKSRCSHC